MNEPGPVACSTATRRGASWVLELWPLILLWAFIALRSAPEAQPQTTKISLEGASSTQLQLIPGIGPVLAEQLMNLQGRDLQSCHGIGAFREAQLRRFINHP